MRFYVELENRLKALEENISTSDSERNQKYITIKPMFIQLMVLKIEKLYTDK